MFALRKLQKQYPACWTDLKRKREKVGRGAQKHGAFKFRHASNLPVSYLFLRGGTLCLRCQGCVTSNASVMDWREGGLRVRSFCALQTL